MPDVYLSPSTQDYNPYIIGGSEKYYMNLLATRWSRISLQAG